MPKADVGVEQILQHLREQPRSMGRSARELPVTAIFLPQASVSVLPARGSYRPADLIAHTNSARALTRGAASASPAGARRLPDHSR
jgi:hypothetical protein